MHRVHNELAGHTFTANSIDEAVNDLTKLIADTILNGGGNQITITTDENGITALYGDEPMWSCEKI